MDIARRALFNSLRMNWLTDSSVKVLPWQVEDYRALMLEELFARLRKKNIELDRVSFSALVENYDSPEDLCKNLLADFDLAPMDQDQVYLLIFELWRRIVNDKPSLSIFCDELDFQIFSYDHGNITHPENIQDAIANLEVILDENTDEGADPVEVFDMISQCCANDIEAFLYDFIAEQIDNHNYPYATELLDSFGHYVKDTSWFDFLRARLLSSSDPEGSDKIIRQIIQDIKKQKDLDLSLEVLSFMANGGDPELFRTLARQTVPILETEEDFQELLAICVDYYHFLDQDLEEGLIQQIQKDRSQDSLERQIQLKDSRVKEFLKIIK